MKPPSSRNAPCPCGSGRRYKECHGALEPATLTSVAQSDPRKMIEQALEAIGRSDLPAAERAARAVHVIDPRHPDAAHVLALVALLRRDFTGALDACDRAIAVLPDHAPFHVTRARALLELTRHADAEQSARRALALAPDDASTWTLLGRTLLPPEGAPVAGRTDSPVTAGDVGAAERAWTKALSLDPADAEARFYLGNAARDRGELVEAIRIYEDALRHRPRDAKLLNNLGLAFEKSGDVDAATARYEAALAANDPPVEAHANIARMLQARQDYPAAAAHYHAYTVATGDAPAEIWSNLAVCQHKMSVLFEAEKSYRKALELVPDSPITKYGLCALLVELGRSEEAIRRLAELNASAPSAKVLHALLCARQSICDWTDWQPMVDAVRAHAAALTETSGDLLIPFNALALPVSPDEQLAIARRFARDYPVPASSGPAAPALPSHGRRLRIGYVSSGFHTHPITYLLTELWERHDRNRLEVYAYSVGVNEDSPLRRRIERAFEHFVDAGFDSIERTIERIRTDRIDILIDLDGYTQGGRTEIFVARPAPMQMHWLGFLGTQGAAWFDYIVTDRFVTPPASQPSFTERFLNLPGGYTPSDTRRPVDPRAPSRTAQGLPEGAVVFCCFNNAYKIVPPVFDAWMRVLRAVPDSVLWLSPVSDATQGNLAREAQSRGVVADRLIYAPRVDAPEYLARLPLADLFLDTWPYNAGTTANDALMMGLPLITCAGQTMVSRVAASQLRTMGMPELVTQNLAEYESLAIALGNSPERRAALRERLRAARSTSPLFDMARYTRDFEDALAAAWDDYEGKSATATS